MSSLFCRSFSPLTGVIRAEWEEEVYESRRCFAVLFPPYRRNKGRVRRRRGWLERRDRQSWTPVGSCQSPPDQKPNSWTYNGVEVSGYTLDPETIFTLQTRAHICKRFRRPGIDSEDSIPPAYVVWRAGTTNRVVVSARQAGNRFLGCLKGLQIRAQF